MKYAAFLRGINVGGKNIIKMDSLKQSFEVLDFKNVKTLIQSGNILFDSDISNKNSLTKKIEDRLKKDFGNEIKVMLRTLTELRKAEQTNPFNNYKKNGDAKFYVCFLYELPKIKIRAGYYEKEACDILAIKDKDVFIVSLPTKNGRYGFPNNLTEKELGTYSTTRNWNTVCKLISKA